MAAIPYLKYEDVSTAIDWLSKTFRFTEVQRFAHDGGAVFHAELATEAGDPVYLAGPGGDYRNPANSGTLTAMVSVDVIDADDAFRHASSAGATVVFPPTDTPQGMRVFKVIDLEGHEWFFSQKL